MIDNKLIGRRIKERRLELGMNADVLGEKVGVARSTIYRLEQGIAKVIKLSTIEDIARILNCSPDYLIGKSNNKEILRPEDDPNPLEISVEEIYNYVKYQLFYNESVTLCKRPITNGEAKTILQALKLGIEMAKEQQVERLIEIDLQIKKTQVI